MFLFCRFSWSSRKKNFESRKRWMPWGDLAAPDKVTILLMHLLITFHARMHQCSPLRQTHNMSNVLQVWAGPLSGNRLAVTLWNRCSETINITMTLPDVGLDGSSAYSVRDLWKVSYIVFIANWWYYSPPLIWRCDMACSVPILL